MGAGGTLYQNGDVLSPTGDSLNFSAVCGSVGGVKTRKEEV